MDVIGVPTLELDAVPELATEAELPTDAEVAADPELELRAVLEEDAKVELDAPVPETSATVASNTLVLPPQATSASATTAF